MFSFAQIALSAVAGGAASVVVLALYRRSGYSSLRTAVPLALVVSASILVWRSAGNTPALNDDPLPFVSPNDVLCPVVTYVSLGLYAAARRIDRDRDWQLVRLLLTAISLVVNIATI